MRFKRLPPGRKIAVELQVKLMLAAHRDCLWSRWTSYADGKATDPTQYQSVCNEGYYGEAFGVMRGLQVMGYGYFGSDTMDAIEEDKGIYPEQNLKWWFRQISHEYLAEEGFFNHTCTAEKCEALLEKYRRLVK